MNGWTGTEIYQIETLFRQNVFNSIFINSISRLVMAYSIFFIIIKTYYDRKKGISYHTKHCQSRHCLSFAVKLICAS